MFKFYEDYIENKQELIKRLNQIIESKMTKTEPLTFEEAFKEVLDDCCISYDEQTIETAEHIVKQCQEKRYTAFKAATVICEELDIEMRINRTKIELALINNQIL